MCCFWPSVLCVSSAEAVIRRYGASFRNAVVFHSRSLLLLLCGQKCLNRRMIKWLEEYADTYQEKHFFESPFLEVLLVERAVIPPLLLQAVLPTKSL